MASGAWLCNLQRLNLCSSTSAPPSYGTWGLATASRLWAWSFAVLVVMEMLVVVVVDANCHFTAIPLLSIQALELNCECPKAQADFKYLMKPPFIIWMVKGKEQEQRLFPNEKEDPDLEVVTNEQVTDTNKGRAKVTLRLKNFKVPNGEVTYFCRVSGRQEPDQPAESTMYTRQSVVNATTAPTATMMTTTKTAPSTTTMAAILLPTPPVIWTAATSVVSTEGKFSNVGLYVTVSLSCLLVIIVVLVIIYIVRVRAQRKGKKLDVDMDEESGPPPGANYKLVNRQAAHRHRPDVGTAILMARDEDDDDDYDADDDHHGVSIETALVDTFMPSRQVGVTAVPAMPARSFHVVDLNHCQAGRGSERFHRYSFPRIDCGDASSDEEITSPGRHYRKRYRNPPRSWSQTSLNRTTRNRCYSALEDYEVPDTWRRKCVWHSRTPRQICPCYFEDIQLQTDLTDDMGGAQRPAKVRRTRGRPRTEPTIAPDSVRIQESASPDRYRDGVDGYRASQALRHGYTERDDLPGAGMRLLEVHQGRSVPARQGGRRDVGQAAVAHQRESPATGLPQQPQPAHVQDALDTRQTSCVRRKFRKRSESPPQKTRKYNTTSMPRHRSHQQAARPRQHPVSLTMSESHLHHPKDHAEAPWDQHTDCSGSESEAPAPLSASGQRHGSRRDKESRRRSLSLGNIPAGGRGDLICEACQRQEETGSQRQMNNLSREQLVSSTQDNPSPLNVPHEQAVVHGGSTPVSTERQVSVRPRAVEAQVMVSTPREGTGSVQSQPTRSNASSSGNDTLHETVYSSRQTGHRLDIPRADDVSLRTIKADNETYPKCRLSGNRGKTSRTSTSREPVACAADMAMVCQKQGDARLPTLSGLKKRESGRSVASTRSLEGSGNGQELRCESLGVALMPAALENGDTLLSDFSPCDHSTKVKRPPHTGPEMT